MLTTVDLRDDLREKAKIMAIKEKTTLREIVNKALEEYIQRKESMGGKKK